MVFKNSEAKKWEPKKNVQAQVVEVVKMNIEENKSNLNIVREVEEHVYHV